MDHPHRHHGKRTARGLVAHAHVFCLLLCAAPTLALPLEWRGGPGDWAVPGNWNPAAVPAMDDDVTINGAGVVSQTGSSVLVNDLQIGLRDNSLLPGKSATGELNLTEGNTTLSGRLVVGKAVATSGAETGSADGLLNTAGSVVPGDVLAGGVIEIGYVGEGAVARAAGVVNIHDGDLVATSGIPRANTLTVGRTLGDGDAEGTLSVGGNVSGVDAVDIGVSRAAGAVVAHGAAAGRLQVGGDLRGNGPENMRLGYSQLGGPANGVALIDGQVSGFRQVSIGVAAGSDADADAEAEFGSLIGPSSSLSVGSANGNTSFAEGTLRVRETISSQSVVNVGTSVFGGTSNGSVFANEVDVQSLSIGLTNQGGTASGSVEVANDTSVFSGARFGYVAHGDQAGTATGNFTSRAGDFTGASHSSLQVAHTFGAASAHGDVVTNGSLGGFAQIDVARVGQDVSGAAHGKVSVNGGDLLAGTTSALLIAATDGSGGSTGEVTVNEGSVVGHSRIEVGRIGAGAQGAARGLLEVTGGDLAGAGSGGVIEIGFNAGGGAARGTVTVEGDIKDFGSIAVGQGSGSGSVDAALELRDGMLEVDNIEVARSLGSGDVSGLLNLNGNLASVADELFLADGSTLALSFDGFSRGIGFGALDVGSAVLGGILDLDFFFQPVTGIFDLIMARDNGSILGDFERVQFHGLAAGTLVNYGVVVEERRQIYRLEIGTGDPIPNPAGLPATFTLFGLGMFALTLFSRNGRCGDKRLR